jgi:hypothetical protein
MRVFLALVPMAACGCLNEVRLLRDASDGGVVVIPTNSNQWPTYYRNRAEYLMHQKCPNGYAIDHEEEFVDNPAADDGRKPYEHFEYDGGYRRISSYERKEYRITFHCAGAERGQRPPAKAKKASPPVGETLPPVEEAPPPRRLPAEK